MQINPRHFAIFRFSLALFTAFALFLHPHMPERKLLLHPAVTSGASIVGHFDPEKGDSTRWINKENSSWRCDYRPEYGHELSCGFSLSWGTGFGESSVYKSYPVCNDASSDEDGDGWGWENELSCIVDGYRKTREEQLVQSVSPTCLYAWSDKDSDGWGWENEQNCRVTKSSLKPSPLPGKDVSKQLTMTEAAPICTNASLDENGDGWGWENGESCLANSPTGEKTVVNVIDFSAYDYLLVNVLYEGRAKSIRFYLRNYSSEYSKVDDLASMKFMSVPVHTADLKTGPVKIKLQEFRVNDWWIVERNAPREWTQTELGAIAVFGMDLEEFGVHKVTVGRVELSGQWISRYSILTFLVLTWGLYLFFELILRYKALKKESNRHEQDINQLSHINSRLEKQKGNLDKLSKVDGLTGALNRHGLEFTFAGLISDPNVDKAGLIMLDIDHGI